MSVLIRKVTSDDFEKLYKLYEEVWPHVDYDKYNKAKFVIKESTGISYCAEEDGVLVGSRTSFWQNLYYGFREVRCLELADSCIHESCRGKGLFLKMNEAFLNDFFSPENKGELIYNISVYASRKAYEKLGWHYIESLMALRKFVHPVRTLFSIGFNPKKLLQPIKWDKRNDDIKIDKALLVARETFFCRKDLLHVKYDDMTFVWRLKSESGIKNFFEASLGCVIYKIGKRGALTEIEIGEVFLYEYTRSSFKKLLKLFVKKQSPDIVKVLVSEGHPMKSWYKSFFFLNNPKQKYLHHGVRVETDEMKEICYQPENWAISSLDIDTF